MQCKTAKWVIRKKMCVFFLFNDILVWTAGKRKSTKVLTLWHSRVAKSSTRKLLLLSAGQSIILYLECASQWERDKWFNAIKIAVNSASDEKVNNFCIENNILEPLREPRPSKFWTIELRF